MARLAMNTMLALYLQGTDMSETPAASMPPVLIIQNALTPMTVPLH